ncbi:MAG: Flp pilus assembly complex ATPase component TadA [Sedimentisphaerales bacterium]|nr:Flp pilus assembly complex ATPase component TadA [Sedimentisphaerales bacterium]MBN2842522.1 Flp pilus assembly complex ATPase component TadA [Sedimentisphaerales bacterium]
MMNVLLQAVPIGGYIAIWKVLIFVLLFIIWAATGQWIDKDSVMVRSNRSFWNNIYMGCGAAIVAVWFILPAVFWLLLLMYTIVWGTVVIAYVMHRNSRVPSNETILTVDHIKFVLSNLFSGKSEKKSHRRLVFISVNDNDLPVPHKEDKEYNGYIVAESLVHDLWFKRVSHAELVPVSAEEYKMRYIIDGVASVGEEIDRDDALDGIKYLKAVAGLDVTERRRPQEGSFFTIRTGDDTTEWRITTSGSKQGEQVVFDRNEEYEDLPLEDLGMHPDQIEQVKDIIDRPSGVVVVGGEAGSGVTSTLYSLVRKHDAFIKNIYSLEKDVISDLDNITQKQIENGSGAASHANQLKSVLHSDPDVIMVDLCDEADMAKMVAKSAKVDSKKFYIGMKATDMFSALDMWVKSVGDPKLAAEQLQAITCQRLVRKLCETCREAYIPDANMIKKLNLSAEKVKHLYRPPSEIFYDKKGNPILCDDCRGSGYMGRTAIYEILVISSDVRKLIAAGAPMSEIKSQCRKEKVLYLQEQALRAVIAGRTSIKEVLRVT